MRLGTQVVAIVLSLLALPAIAECDAGATADCRQQYQDCMRGARTSSDTQDCRNSYSVCMRSACSGQGSGGRG